MKVLVCGSRHFYDWRLLENELYEFGKDENITTIIHGCAAGADSLAGQYAIYEGIPVVRFPADWNLHGKKAGSLRNSQMLRDGQPDQVFAFLAEGSKGTKNMIEQAQKAGIPVRIIHIGSEHV